MEQTKSKPAEGVRWDLSDLYKGIDDPKIVQDKSEIEKTTEDFIKKYKGKINSPDLTSDFLLQSLLDFESIWEKSDIYASFASYLHSQNTNSPINGKFFQESGEFVNKISSQLLWFTLEWVGLPDKKAGEIIKDNKLSKYRHYLLQTRVFKPFLLKEDEEVILNKKSQTAGSAFVRLYDETSSVLEFEMEIKGKKEKLSYDQIGSILEKSGDREERKRATESITNEYKKQEKLFTFIFNTLILDKKVDDEIRKYKYPQEATFLSYEVKSETVKRMTEVVQNSYSIPEKFYLLKGKLLGYRELYEWDRYSPIYPEVGFSYS